MPFLSALQFLTVVSPPFRRGLASMTPAAVNYFAVVGLLLGLALAGVDILVSAVFPPGVAAALLTAAMVVLTGALHLDGFMDTCDGIFYRGEPARRLEIMRDSRVGAFGAIGLATLLLVKYSALAALTAPVGINWEHVLSSGAGFTPFPAPALLRPFGLILIATAARLAMAYCLVFFPYARPSGLGKYFQGESGKLPLAISTILIAALAYLLLGVVGLVSLAIGGVVVWLGALYVMTKIPGLTGDVYGALGEVMEVTILLALVALR